MAGAMLAESIADAFGLGTPVSAGEPVQHTVSRTWRLTTTRGRYLVKELWAGDDPFWAGETLGRMAYENVARTRGVRTARPITVDGSQAFGLGARVGGRGCFRVFDWIPHDPDYPVGDEWLVRTLTTLHRIETVRDRFPRYYGIYSSDQWAYWLELAEKRRAGWLGVARAQFPEILALTERLRRRYADATDHVKTHGDFLPANVLVDPSGPVLIDWESVGGESAMHEVGDTMFRFFDGDFDRIERGLAAYLRLNDSFGRLDPDGLFDKTIGTRLANITELIKVSAEAEQVVDGWRARVGDPDEFIASRLQALPGFAGTLEQTSRDIVR